MEKQIGLKNWILKMNKEIDNAKIKRYLNFLLDPSSKGIEVYPDDGIDKLMETIKILYETTTKRKLLMNKDKTSLTKVD